MQNRQAIATFEVQTGACMGVGPNFVTPVEAFDMTKAGWPVSTDSGGETILEVMPMAEAKRVFLEVCPDRALKAKGEPVGRYLDCEIPAWVELASGKKYQFERACGQGGNDIGLGLGQIVIHPGLVYAPQ